MKHVVTTRNVWSCLLVVCALMIWACGSLGKSATAPSQDAGVSAVAAPAIAIPVHFVTGSALIRQMPGLEGRNAIEARAAREAGRHIELFRRQPVLMADRHPAIRQAQIQ